MRIEQRRLSEAGGWERISGDLEAFPPQVVLAFGGRFALERCELHNQTMTITTISER
jgi:hypothetical protein